MPTFRAEWHGLNEALNFLMMLGVNADNIVGRGIGLAAIEVQDEMRNNLVNMIYAQPPGLYQRTYTLMRSTHAARPGAAHDGDESRAHSGMDLRADDPDSVWEASGHVIEAEAGSWVSYADKVHRGINQPQARPFVEQTIQMAESAMDKNVMDALIKAFAAAPRG